VRTLPVLLLAVGVVASLASCATAPFSNACAPTVHSGDASEVISAQGDFGDQPVVDFPTPIKTSSLQRTELLPGDGAVLAEGDIAVIKFSVFNGDTGGLEAQGDYAAPGQMLTLGASANTAVSVGLQCATVGSRVAIVSSATDAGQDPAQYSNTFVFVIDVVKAFPAKAWGVPQIPQAGMPSVVTAPNGAPGVTVPREDPPTELTVNLLQEASGEKLKADDRVVMKYTAFLWSDSSVFDSTWTSGQAKIIPLTESDSVTSGFVKGLVGQPVGSQVLIVVPPELGFGTAGSTGVPPDSTLIYVVDILGVDG